MMHPLVVSLWRLCLCGGWLYVTTVSALPRRAVVIAVDGGTESVRASAWDVDGQLVNDAIVSVPYKTMHPHPGWACQDPHEWYEALGQAVRGVVGQLLDNDTTATFQIRGICMDTTCCTVVALDRDKQPIDCLLWMDQRSAVEASTICELAPNHPALSVNGNGDGPVSAEWMTSKALWMKKHLDWQKTIAHVCEYQDYLNYKLTGQLVCSSCNAATRWHWDGNAALQEPTLENPYPGRPLSLYQTLGLDDLAEKLPHVCLAMGGQVGTLTPEASKHLHLPMTTPVFQGGPDAFVGMIGLGCIQPGQMCLITGSSHLHCVVSSTDQTSPGIWGAYRGAPLPGMCFAEGGQSSTGSILRWAKRELFDDIPSYRELDEEASKLSPGADGLLALETFQGRRTPVTDPLARGSLVGLTLSHTRGHLWRALLEAVCFGTRACIDGLEAAGHNCEEIALAGGVTHSQVWLQMHADVTNRTICVGEHSANAPLLGCAILACVGAGLHANVQEAVEKMVRTKQRIEPRSNMVKAYDRVYQAAYRQLSDAVKPVVHALSDLRGGASDADDETFVISPSLLACDWANIQSEVRACLDAGMGRLHVDIFDGVFLDSPHAFSFGPKMVHAIWKSACPDQATCQLDLHMCVQRPERFVEAMASILGNRGCFIFQLEATSSTSEASALAEQIANSGMQCGVSINPSTSIDTLWPLLETGLVLLVDVLAVEPGFGGQTFQTIALSKVRQLRAWREKHSVPVTIMVDGGINDETVSSVLEAGADVLVAGSYLFQHRQGLLQGRSALLASAAKRSAIRVSKTI